MFHSAVICIMVYGNPLSYDEDAKLWFLLNDGVIVSKYV